MQIAYAMHTLIIYVNYCPADQIKFFNSCYSNIQKVKLNKISKMRLSIENILIFVRIYHDKKIVAWKRAHYKAKEFV